MKKTVIDKRICRENDLTGEIERLHALGYAVEVNCSIERGMFDNIIYRYEISVIKWEEVEE